MWRMLVMWTCLALVVALGHPAVAGEEEKPALPLPLHTVEGTGGILTTQAAYLVNPAVGDAVFGLPSFGVTHLQIGHGRRLEAVTITETLWDRVELGYAYTYLDLGDLARDVRRSIGIRMGDHSSTVHNFNARLALLKEGTGHAWVPAITAGVSYKYNEDIDNMDEDLGGALRTLKIDSDYGLDFTLYATKMITALPRPVLLSAGVRSTEAAHLGLLGFTEGRSTVLEGNVVVLATSRLALAAEYRQKPHRHRKLGNLIEREDDWWTLAACYIISENLTVTGGYGHFGHLLNHNANGVWGLKFKWEF